MNNKDIDNIMKNALTKDCLEFLDILNNNGYESFAVGGCVRDALLGNIPKDEDLTTNATPEEVRKVFSKIKGFSVWDSGLKHGTVTVVKGDTSIEITTYRSDGEYSDGRRPDSVIFEDSIDKDLARRDFTINALAWSPRDGFKDNYNGLEDLENGVIRAVGNANERISEDALRMMRAIRFSARYGFDVEDSLVEAIKNNSQSLSNVSKERIRDELCKTLMTDNPTYVKRFKTLGLMKYISPEIDNLFHCPQNCVYHDFNVGVHTMQVLKLTPKDLNLRMAALLHDVGKPISKTTDEKGFDHFYNHSDMSEAISLNVLRDLKFSTDEIKDICKLVKFHDLFLDLPGDNTKKIYEKCRNFVIENPDLESDFYSNLRTIQKCDLLGKSSEKNKVIDNLKNLKKIEVFEDVFSKILEGPHRIKDLALKGNDLMELKVEDRKGNIHYCKGPTIKELQKILLKEVIDNPSINDKESLTKVALKNLIQAEANVDISRRKQKELNELKVSNYNKAEDYQETLKINYFNEKCMDTDKKKEISIDL